MRTTARVQGKTAIGRATKGDLEIFAFRAWGRIVWSGDLEQFRSSKAEAYADAMAMRERMQPVR
jgi:hypothetical protein